MNSIEREVRKYLSSSATVRRGLYSISEHATSLYISALKKISTFLGVDEKTIFFVSSPYELPIEVCSGPFDEVPNGLINISNFIHRRANMIYLEGASIGFKGLDIVSIEESILRDMEPIEVGGDMVLKVSKYSYIADELPFRFSAGTPDIAGVIALGEAANSYIMPDVEKNIAEIREYLEANNIDYKFLEFSSCFIFNGREVYASKGSIDG